MSASHDSFEGRYCIEGENRVHIEFNWRAHLRYLCQLTLFYGSLFRMPRENCSVALDLPRMWQQSIRYMISQKERDCSRREDRIRTSGTERERDSYSSRVCLLRPAISNLKNFYFLRKLWEAVILSRRNFN